MANTYTTYKDSGIPWIGKIPELWDTIHIPYVFQNLDYLREPISSDKRSRNNPIYDYYGASGVIDKIDFYNVDDEVLLIGEDGANLRLRNLPLIYKAKGKFWVNNHAHILKPYKDDYNYMAYMLESLDYNVYITGSAQPKLSQDNLSKIKVCVPSLEEQESIANFLDKKCSEIDELISLQEKMIDELKAYKQSVITEAVTKGLDRNVKMKDSGVDWIGEIPEHWVTRQFKWLFSIKKDIAGELGYDVLSVTQKGIKIKDLSKNEGQIAQDYSKYQLVNPNDFVMNHMDLLTGYVDCSKYNGVTSPDYRVFHAINESSTSLAYYLRIFQTCYSCKIFYGLGQGVSGFGRWRLPAEQQKLFYLPYPPYAEQQEIASFLDTKCSQIDSLISIKEKKIEELKDYKKSLIYEYVTGKKRV